MKRHSPSNKKFVEPNTTQTPNVFFDSILKTLKGEAEVKICLVVIRHTYGWWEKTFEMTIADLCEMTGLARANVQRAAQRLAKSTPERPAILGRKRKGKGPYATYAYWLVIDTGKKEASRGHESRPPEAMNHGPQRPRIMAPIRNKEILSKEISKRGSLSSSKSPTVLSGKSAMDDDKKLAEVVAWFRELSNGSEWHWSKDTAAYQVVQAVPNGIILMALCHAVDRAPAHKFDRFSYCVPIIKEILASGMKDMDPETITGLALRARKKMLRCIKLDKWTATDFTDSEWKEFNQEFRSGT